MYINVDESPATHEIISKTGNVTGVTWQYCVAKNTKEFGGAEGHGFAADGFNTDTVIKYCLAYDNEGNGFNVNMVTFPTVHNNISYGNSNEGFGYMFGSSSGLFYNNTAYNNSGHGFRLYTSATGITIKNNISFSNNYGFSGATGSSATHDYNCAYNNTTDNWDGVVLTKQAHDIESDPLFANPSNNDFTSQSDAPCIDAGTNPWEQGMGR